MERFLISLHSANFSTEREEIMAIQKDPQKKEIERAYKTALLAVRRELRALSRGLEGHGRAQAMGRNDWGRVVDLNHVARMLSEINNFLGK